MRRRGFPAAPFRSRTARPRRRRSRFPAARRRSPPSSRELGHRVGAASLSTCAAVRGVRGFVAVVAASPARRFLPAPFVPHPPVRPVADYRKSAVCVRAPNGARAPGASPRTFEPLDGVARRTRPTSAQAAAAARVSPRPLASHRSPPTAFAFAPQPSERSRPQFVSPFAAARRVPAANSPPNRVGAFSTGRERAAAEGETSPADACSAGVAACTSRGARRRVGRNRAGGRGVTRRRVRRTHPTQTLDTCPTTRAPLAVSAPGECPGRTRSRERPRAFGAAGRPPPSSAAAQCAPPQRRAALASYRAGNGGIKPRSAPRRRDRLRRPTSPRDLCAAFPPSARARCLSTVHAVRRSRAVPRGRPRSRPHFRGSSQ